MSATFLHSSDLHLGKAFGGYPEALRNRLREARHGCIARLAQAARAKGAQTVVLAGDTFDAETPAPDTRRHALRAMAAEADIRWFLLPGNHDSLAASELWRLVCAEAPENLHPVLNPEPFQILPGAWILPAPCTQRRPGRDLSETMQAATPQGALRIGLAHGAVTDFSGEEGVTGIIPPDRARLSGLDYLALGDWHGRLQVGPGTWYSGTPEADSFKHALPAGALLVTLHAAGAPAQVQLVETGQFGWHRLELDLLEGDDPAAQLSAVLPPVAGRRNLLVALSARGRLPLSAHAALAAALAAAGPDFGWFAPDLSALATQTSPDDLDRIDHAGALRHAAEGLLADSTDPAQPAAARRVAAAALARLYALAQEVQV